MRFAVIDIGSNTIKMTVSDVTAGEKPVNIMTETVTAGLIFYISDNLLSDPGAARLIEVLSGFGSLAKRLSVDKLWCTATASLRNLKNTDDIVRLVAEHTGIKLEIISWEQEAYYSFNGLCASVDPPPRRGVMIDMGGGSTELLGFIDGLAVRTGTLPFGCLSLFHDFVSGILPTDKECRAIRKRVKAACEPMSWLEGWGDTVYLVGGTARALASLHDAIYSTGRPVNGYTMTADEAAATFKYFRDADKERISLLTRLVPDRLHTIIPGLCAYRRLISIIGASNVVIALGGLREGYLAERLAEAKDNGELA